MSLQLPSITSGVYMTPSNAAKPVDGDGGLFADGLKTNKSLNDRLDAWARLGGPSLMALVARVNREIVPFFLENGFERVSRYMRDPSDPISAREIRLEHLRGDEIFGISISFDKYRRPAFQMQVERRLAGGSQDWVRAANIVKRPEQLICFWGAPWWLPRRFWSPARSQHVATRLRTLSPAMLTFLEDGVATRHFSVTADATPP